MTVEGISGPQLVVRRTAGGHRGPLFELDWTERLADDLLSGRIPFQEHQPPKLTFITEEDDHERKTS